MQADFLSFVVVFALGFILVVVTALVYFFEAYKLVPGWGPIRKFDSDGNEDLRFNQLLIHSHIGEQSSAVGEPKEYVINKGTLQTEAPGLGLRLTKRPEDKEGDDVYLAWGTTTSGVDEGDGWLRVRDRFLPMVLNGVPVLRPLEARYYGTMGGCTWGNLEAPWTRLEKVWHPQYGEVTLRHGFADTQYIRSHSGWWARDEPHFFAQAGVKAPPLVINEETGDRLQQNMV